MHALLGGNALGMLRAVDLSQQTRCLRFPATGITDYLKHGGTLEKAQTIACHESPKSTKLCRHGKRVDYEYERAGTANIFMFAESLAGWREVAVRDTKTKVDWAIEMALLLEGRYAEVERVTLVCDNLNTHAKGAFYETFTPARARQLVRHIEFCHTPKHGSWLNIAENELSSLTRQCVAGRRFGESQTLRAETSARSPDVNTTQRGVDSQMKIDDARYKLRSGYPKIKL